MPINVPANCETTTVYGTQLTIGSQIQTALQALAATTELLDISIVKLAVGNNFMAVISYEDAP